ncbi:MAG: hypothetical protein FJ246_02070 [Nitrospira sp.]|nr:hypothetical protein [Nitrospira sp.]
MMPTTRFQYLLLGPLLLILLTAGCAGGPDGPGLSGVYLTWDDVINRWIGKNRVDLQIEIGPPTFHQKEVDGMKELRWDMTIPTLPGMAEQYNTLPMYGFDVNCQLVFVVNENDIVVSGHRIGCD